MRFIFNEISNVLVFNRSRYKTIKIANMIKNDVLIESDCMPSICEFTADWAYVL